MKLKYLIPIFAVLVLVPTFVLAGQDKSFYLPAGESYNANLYEVGQSINIAGTVNGDVYAVGKEVNISGSVKGDVFVVASEVRISGQVDGNVRAVGRTITLNSVIKRAVALGGEKIYFNDQSSVGATAITFASHLEMRGNIAGNLDGAAQNALITGSLTHTNLYTEELILTETAEIRGNLNYSSSREANIEAGATVNGEINRTVRVVSERPSDGSQLALRKLWQLLSLLLIGLIFIWLMPKRIAELSQPILVDPWRILLWGLAVFVLTPLAIIALMFTVIGIPLGIIILAAYGIMLYVARIFSAVAIGLWLARRFHWTMALSWVFLIGLVVYLVLTVIPFFGDIVALAAMWFGLGALARYKYQILQGWRVDEPTDTDLPSTPPAM
ncbi:MAG: polymer-forming cytoskeletal protein [Candidatus Komeilibacteria bacterium]|nr:polymer-forming cytoskeletal protein [Candidatus Komeilibacteria bacterium]